MQPPNPVPDYLQVLVAWVTVLGVLGVIAAVIGLAIQVAKSRTEAKDRDAQAVIERERFDKQIATLQQAENDRLAAQARKVVPLIARADPSYGPNMWAVRIQNKSTEVINDLAVLVTALDANGNVVEDACHRETNVELSPLMRGIFSDAISVSIGEIVTKFPAAGLGALGGMPGGIPGMGGMPQGMNLGLPNQRQTENAIKKGFGPQMTEKLQDAIQSSLSGDWPTTLIPEQSETRIYVAQDATVQLRVAIQYEDSAGYLWNRTDRGKPQRVSVPANESPATSG